MIPTTGFQSMGQTSGGFGGAGGILGALRSIGAMTILVAVAKLVFWIIRLGGFFEYAPELALKKFQIWRNFLYPFGANGFLDFLVSLIALIFLGQILEKSIGSVNFLLRIVADAAFFTFLILTPLYLLFSLFSPTIAKSTHCIGMSTIFIIEAISQWITNPRLNTTLFGTGISLPQFALPVAILVLRMFFGEFAGIWAVLAGFIHSRFLKGCFVCTFDARSIFSAEKAFMFLDRFSNFYTLNDKSALNAGHPVFSTTTPTSIQKTFNTMTSPNLAPLGINTQTNYSPKTDFVPISTNTQMYPPTGMMVKDTWAGPSTNLMTPLDMPI